MKSIRIKELEIINFKGIKSLKLDFGTDGNRSIYGANGTGKTTIFDAFTWLLFNKDSQGRNDFEIKHLDPENNVTENQQVEVYAELLIDDEVVEVRKALKEKWVTKRGSETSEFTGNETAYFYNSVPLSQKEFQSKIGNIVDENVFKMITNPNAFVSLKWQDQRKTLVELTEIPSDKEIALGDLDLENLLNEIGNQKTMDEFIAQTKHSIKKAKDEIDSVPARIEELNRSLPTPIVEKNITANIEALQAKLETIDNEITNKMAQFDTVIENRNKHKSAIQALVSKINDIEFNVKEESKTKANQKDPSATELKSLKMEFDNVDQQAVSALLKVKNLEAEIAQLENNRATLRDDWKKVNAKKFELKEDDTTCKCCGQALENFEGLKNELEYKFNGSKQQVLKSIQTKGEGYKQEQELKEKSLESSKLQLEEHRNSNKERSEKIEVLEKKIKDSSAKVFDADKFIVETLLGNSEYNALKTEKLELEKTNFDTPTEDVAADLKLKKQPIQAEINKLQGYLKDKEIVTKTNERIGELKDVEKSQNQVVAQFERKLFLVEKFNKKKIELLDQTVNKMFSLVKFKLFDYLINGGVKETCEAMVNGVPFSNVNTAMRTNAGIDIINTLCDYYKVNAPIFVDNKESVTTLIYTESQKICLEVSPEDTVLRIN